MTEIWNKSRINLLECIKWIDRESQWVRAGKWHQLKIFEKLLEKSEIGCYSRRKELAYNLVWCINQHCGLKAARITINSAWRNFCRMTWTKFRPILFILSESRLMSVESSCIQHACSGWKIFFLTQKRVARLRVGKLFNADRIFGQ